ncbi:hypothetical protein GBA65_06945 [Rubrobacter marinus]|uniref:Uncharacterized protein n=1 Tax=Rubrobacter marinus TaxID=2653852 RepID=A0A6G8PVQ8_9ACTN|nr:SIR2 family protein [Rubrobacter marinus]QIN78292.1 hypothetical protein GBA65_06945 [Rubrobacter marinus]
MTKAVAFRDQPQIQRIRERLWSERDYGRAAVMVGAGFSRNATTVSPGVPRFPLWGDTAERMLEDLYPSGNPDEGPRGRRKALYGTASGAMRLASEYEISFGRSALDNLLLESIPDASYEPGRLHDMLLSLPWADVFTTNYDTLLERARSRVFERKYGLVLDPSDVPAHEQPRIVKLHGSFPSQRPFVITEEDFRAYPARSAPFVSLVQQSIAENAFCLLGFSGEDPNFLSWTGWVRDNLGPSAPRVYLCGLLDLSGPTRRLLESRNVIPVDLSPLFPPALWPRRDERHEKATEWLLLNLMNGKPPDPDDWLAPPSRRHRWRPSFDRPEVPEGPSLFTPSEPSSHQGFADNLEQLTEVLETWRRQRLEYPGWAVAPYVVRSKLWPETQFWIDPILRSLGELPAPRNLEILYEFNWRLEKALIPLFNVWSEKIVEVLTSFNPFPDLVGIDGATVTPRREEHAELDWASIAEWWVELSFAVIREAREDQDDSKFRLWMDRLDDVVGHGTEWRSRWFYEDCLFHLYRFDQEALRAGLQEWAREATSPPWDVKRAALLSELGELEEAERLAETALNRIREQLHPYSQDHALMSQEGWVMLLLEIIDSNVRDQPEGRRELFQERYKALEPRRCNPKVEVERLGSRVRGPVPQEIMGIKQEATRPFDPDMAGERITFGSGFPAAPAFPAFGFLRMLEEGGIPLKCGGVRIYPEDVEGCARWIKPYAPLWSLSALLRSVEPAQEEELDGWFDRVRVATLPRN